MFEQQAGSIADAMDVFACRALDHFTTGRLFPTYPKCHCPITFNSVIALWTLCSSALAFKQKFYIFVNLCRQKMCNKIEQFLVNNPCLHTIFTWISRQHERIEKRRKREAENSPKCGKLSGRELSPPQNAQELVGWGWGQSSPAQHCTFRIFGFHSHTSIWTKSFYAFRYTALSITHKHTFYTQSRHTHRFTKILLV